jgi:hypothetical protein
MMPSGSIRFFPAGYRYWLGRETINETMRMMEPLSKSRKESSADAINAIEPDVMLMYNLRMKRLTLTPKLK